MNRIQEEFKKGTMFIKVRRIGSLQGYKDVKMCELFLTLCSNFYENKKMFIISKYFG